MTKRSMNEWAEEILGRKYPDHKDFQLLPLNNSHSLMEYLQGTLSNLKKVVNAANFHLENSWLHEVAEKSLGGKLEVTPQGDIRLHQNTPSVDDVITLSEADEEVPLPPTIQSPVTEKKKKLPSIQNIRKQAKELGVNLDDLGVKNSDKEEALARIEKALSSPLGGDTKKQMKYAPSITPTQILSINNLPDKSLGQIAAGENVKPSLTELIKTSEKITPEDVRPWSNHDPEDVLPVLTELSDDNEGRSSLDDDLSNLIKDIDSSDEDEYSEEDDLKSLENLF